MRAHSTGLNYSCGVFIGTSITLGVRTGVTIDQALPNLVGSAKHLVPTVNAGVSGNTSTDILARFETDCLAYAPGMIYIECGTNDPGASISTGTYSSNVTEMIRKAKITGARVTLGVSIYAQNSTLDASIAPYRTVMRGLASTYSCDLFDPYNDIVALATATQNSYYLEAPGSGQHMSPAGLAWAAGLVGSGAYVNSFKAAISPNS